LNKKQFLPNDVDSSTINNNIIDRVDITDDHDGQHDAAIEYEAGVEDHDPEHLG